MGFMNILSPISNLFGGGEDKPVETPPSVTPAADTKTAVDTQAEADKKKKAALLAVNAGGAQGGTTTVGGGNADVTRKLLLGL